MTSDDAPGVDEELADRLDDEGVVYTAGVSSAVLDGDECVGHVLLLDCDDVDALTAYRAAESMNGVTAVLESSEGSYHVWNLTVRPFEEAILDGLSWRIADSEHVAQSRRRGRYVLRATSKVRDDGTRYKAPPKLLDVFVNLTDEDGDDVGPQSLPHLLRLEAMVEEQEADVAVPSPAGISTVGGECGLAVDRYMTLTDEGKDRLRAGGSA